MPVQIKRIYDKSSQDDGVRILVDRIWPRGMSKADAELDEWLKEVGPSHQLRKWYGHDSEKFKTFKKKYQAELQTGDQKVALNQLKELTKKHHKKVTLLFAAKDEKYNQAAVLKEILDRQ